MRKCDCAERLWMHDSSGVCNNWQAHGALPCNRYHDVIDIPEEEAIRRMSNNAESK